MLGKTRGSPSMYKRTMSRDNANEADLEDSSGKTIIYLFGELENIKR